MTPLSNILTDRAETFSLTDTLTRVEQAARDTVSAASEQSREHAELGQIKQALLDMKTQIDMMVAALDSMAAPRVREPEPIVAERIYVPPVPQPEHHTPPPAVAPVSPGVDARVIEGVFDGEHMVGEDGNRYAVPPNYASKSKMVEGDLLKLTITHGGKQFYKQIGPVERKAILGELSQDPTGNWVVIANMKPYRILSASVTFHRARQGAKAMIHVPESGEARWGAVDSFLS